VLRSPAGRSLGTMLLALEYAATLQAYPWGRSPVNESESKVVGYFEWPATCKCRFSMLWLERAKTEKV